MYYIWSISSKRLTCLGFPLLRSETLTKQSHILQQLQSWLQGLVGSEENTEGSSRSQGTCAEASGGRTGTEKSSIEILERAEQVTNITAQMKSREWGWSWKGHMARDRWFNVTLRSQIAKEKKGRCAPQWRLPFLETIKVQTSAPMPCHCLISLSLVLP